jgi:hypothetical protein
MKKLNFKKQIIGILTESFSNDDKDKLKKVFKLIKENEKLKDLYLFYEEIENKYFDDKNVATEYVISLSEQLKGKDKILRDENVYNVLKEDVIDFQITNEELYSHLDVLLEEDNIRNIDKKIISKKYLVNYLTTKREIEETEETVDTINENLLNTVLVTNFNIYYDSLLNEEEKNTLKSIINMSDDEVGEKFEILKEDISTRLNNLIIESSGELKEKLEITKSELYLMDKTKLNYYKLTELKNGL